MARGTKLTEHIVIGTPGKVVDWVIKMKALDLKKVKVFVLDEADVMIATQGHQVLTALHFTSFHLGLLKVKLQFVAFDGGDINVFLIAGPICSHP